MRIVGAYEVIIPRRRTVKSTKEGNRQNARCTFAAFSSIPTGKILTARYKYKKIEIADIILWIV